MTKNRILIFRKFCWKIQSGPQISSTEGKDYLQELGYSLENFADHLKKQFQFSRQTRSPPGPSEIRPQKQF
jgi:hypothetical protein